MKKMFYLLENVTDLNTFYRVEEFEHVNGNQQNLYFRLEQVWSGNKIRKQRYLPSSSAAVTVTFDSLDQANVISRAATMAFPNDDRSIWMVTLVPNDVIFGNMSVTLVDNGLTEVLLLDGRLIGSTTGYHRFYG